ncbi:unnamed protein product, partial [marine sediment metagenome]
MGDSVYSNEVAVTTEEWISPVVPDNPSNLLTEAVSGNQINLSWTDNSDNEYGFIIDRKIGSGSWKYLTT